ncbi:MAG TPA: ABC transporter permease [Thermoanaerobaculia bacterium]|nr:ABC transporter permease [Thermoanaerobaculia bacterium]
MDKMLAVLKREYLAGVRKKMFIVMTLVFPLFLGGIFLIPIFVMGRGLGQKKVAVIDATGSLQAAFAKPDEIGKAAGEKASMSIEYVDAKGQSPDTSAKPYLDRMNTDNSARKLDAVLVVPPSALDSSDATLKFYSRSAADIITQERIASMTNRGIHAHRLALRGFNEDEANKLLASAKVDGIQISKTGEEKKGGTANFLGGLVLCGLFLFPSFIYGLEIMRGIIQEKNDRVVEVLVSSMSPKQLLTGKILGTALIGLTQVSVWLLMAALGGAFAAQAFSFAGENITRFLHPSMFVYFIVFFLLAYLTYVCVYAIAGAACNSDKEAQQLIGPITMLMMLPWFLVAVLITNPDSSLAVGFSLAPVFGPMTMFLRTLVTDPPLWHIAVSIVVSIITITLFFRVTAKIFRVGILSYGKRPTIPELWRWLKVA